MKKATTMLLLGMLALSLSACATLGGEEEARVKCPKCGYEFNAPSER